MPELRNDRIATLQQLMVGVAMLPHAYDITVKCAEISYGNNSNVAMRYETISCKSSYHMD
jgi:hypothetical protein